MKNRFLQLLTWSVVVLIFVYVLGSIVPPEKAQGVGLFGRLGMAFDLIRSTVAQANLPAIVTLVLGYMVYLIIFDTAGTAYVVRRFNCAMTFGEMLPARCVTFLIAALNYQAGQVALPLYLKRAHRVPFLEASSSVLFLALLDFSILFVMVFFGCLFLDDPKLRSTLIPVAIVGMAGYVLHAIFWRKEAWSKPVLRFLARLPFLGKLFQDRALFHAFQIATFKDYLVTFALRAPIHVAIIASLYWAVRCFHAHVPFAEMLIYMPIIMIGGSIPILNVGSIGAGQALLVFFFKKYAPEATLIAASLIWVISINGLKVAIGALFLSRYSTDLFKPEENPAEPISA